MKSKLFLIIITIAISFAVYSLFNNIGNTKNELGNSTTAHIVYQQKAVAQQYTHSAKINKPNGRRYGGNYSNSVSNAPVVAFSKHKSGNVSKSSLFDGNYTAQNINTSRRSYSIASSDLSGGSVIASSYGMGGRNNGNKQTGLLASSTLTPFPMGAPMASGDVIIIDPGGDPTGPPIPVGDGAWIFVLLAVCYIGWKRFR